MKFTERLKTLTSPTNIKRGYIHLLGDDEKRILDKLLNSETEELSMEDRNTLNKFSISTLKALVAEASKQGFEEAYSGFDVGFLVPRPTIDVLICGACGDIGYNIIPRICSGEMFGLDQPINIRLYDIEENADKLKAIEMEIEDCAFPLLHKIISTHSEREAFYNVDYAILCSGKSENVGQSRSDLILQNAPIYASFGRSLYNYAKNTTKVLVVADPVNTNCLILASNARSLPPENITGLVRLDQNRATAALARKLNVNNRDVRNVNVWGNSSQTIFPDVSQVIVGGKYLSETWSKYGLTSDWLNRDFVEHLFHRPQEILKLKGHSETAATADAIVRQMRDWVFGSHGELASMIVPSDGFSYNVKEGLFVSFPVICHGDTKYDIIKNIKFDAERQRFFDGSIKELYDERDQVREFLR